MALVPLPPPDEESDEPVTVSLRFSKQEWDDFKLIAALWNRVDAARGVKRRLKWKTSSVLRYAARNLRDTIREQIADWPENEAEQEEFLRRVIADAEKELRKEQSRKK